MVTTKDTESRERVLKKVRNALIAKSVEKYDQTDFAKPIYHDESDPVEVVFARNFTAISGKFSYCENEEELIAQLKQSAKEGNWNQIICLEENLQKILKSAEVSFISDLSRITETLVGITGCEFLVARFGSVMVSSKQASGRKLPVFPDKHIVIAYTDQVVLDLKDAYSGIKQKYGAAIPSLIANIAGPSRSADIEKTLVVGAHGPKEIYVFLVER